MLFYKLALCLCQPVALAALLVLAAAVLHGRRLAGRVLLAGGAVLLWLGGNHWVAHGLARSLERRHPAPAEFPVADVIVVVGGGLLPPVPPRGSIEVGEAGDRTLYAARLYRQGKAPAVLCTSGIVPGSPRERPYAEDEAAMLTWLGVPPPALWSENQSRTTYENAKRGYEVLRQHQVRRALLVTSALHMPRSWGVFTHNCPGIEFIAAPTDFRAVDEPAPPFVVQLARFIPSAANLQLSAEVVHEWGGLLYYKLRGWM
jgi:uncharacterized SAM-binding protein YcdF (DUF218 family)